MASTPVEAVYIGIRQNKKIKWSMIFSKALEIHKKNKK
jgi:hypothetical protein